MNFVHTKLYLYTHILYNYTYKSKKESFFYIEKNIRFNHILHYEMLKD